MFIFLRKLPTSVAVLVIVFYQKTLSPDHGVFKHFFPYGYCRFVPTCSDYGIQAIKKHGCLKGGAKTVWRVLRCNPFSKGGFDPLN